MVVTLALETDEARAASEAALQGEGQGQVLLVPRLSGRFASVGTVASIEEAGALPNGMPAILVRGIERAVIGAGVPGRRSRRRSTGSSAPASRTPSTPGSATTSTGWSTSPGASAPRTPTTSVRHAGSSTPTTPGSTT
ncbi:MAG: hypothetical protein ACRDPR_24090 [Nocardioidaceae bacterium]